MRVFGRDDWDIFELRRLLGVVSASLHVQFVAGNTEGRIRADAAVLSAFLASCGVLRYGEITAAMRERTPPPRSRRSAWATSRRASWTSCRAAKPAASCWRASW